MVMELKEDYFADYPIVFTLEPRKTALIIVDLQYGSASRSTGLCKLLSK